jgi:ligand-binding SRPBCC domain-containing protein
MRTEVFVRRTRIPAPAAAVFRWHDRPDAFEQLTPPWEHVRVVERTGGITDGRMIIEMRIGPLRRRWVAQLVDFQPDRQFRDVQVEGPFARWEHTHTVEPDGPSACYLEDRIEYALPLGWLGSLLAGPFVRKKLDRLFAYRHHITAEALRAADPKSPPAL